jgi:xanthine/uracil permease
MSGACKFKPYQPQQQNDNKVEEPDNKKLETFLLASMAVVIVLIAWIHLLQPTSLGNIGVVIAVLVGVTLYSNNHSSH